MKVSLENKSNSNYQTVFIDVNSVCGPRTLRVDYGEGSFCFYLMNGDKIVREHDFHSIELD